MNNPIEDYHYVNLSDDTSRPSNKQKLLQELAQKQQEEAAFKNLQKLLSNGIKCSQEESDSNVSMHEKLYKSNLVASNLQKSKKGEMIFQEIEQTESEDEETSSDETSMRSDAEKAIESAESSQNKSEIQDMWTPTNLERKVNLSTEQLSRPSVRVESKESKNSCSQKIEMDHKQILRATEGKSTTDNTTNIIKSKNQYQEVLDFDDNRGYSSRSIQHYDTVFEEFSCHLLAHEEFQKKKKTHRSSKEALNHNFNQILGQIEIDNKFKDTKNVIDQAQSIVYKNFKPVEQSVVPDQEFRDSVMLSQSELKGRIEEAVILDEPRMLHQLKVTRSQILEFVYTVRGAKSLVSGQNSPRMYRSADSQYFSLSISIVMLCCHYNSVKVLNYLYTNIVGNSPNPREVKKELLSPKCAEGGVSAVHLASFFGNLEVLRILSDKFDADFGEKTERGLTPLHCAAQRKEGIVTIYFLKDTYKYFDPNVVDVYGGTPLHYAIMSIEEYNIHALMSLGSDINKKDKKGDSVLHVALARYVDDQENYGLYKEVVKGILQFGARRDIKNKQGLTPIQLLRQFKSKITLQTREDYIKEGVDFTQEHEPENQYKKFEFYLGHSHKENRLCCPKHAPLYKIKRSSTMMFVFMIVNLVILLLQISLFWFMYSQLRIISSKESMYHERVWISFILLSIFFYLLSVMMFIITLCKDPGYTKSIQVTKFNEYLDKALKEDRNLDYFCFFCRCIWSQSSVHCMTCMRCVEGFDHHCTIINNCIGYKNHRNFLIFLIFSFFYTLALIGNSVQALKRRMEVCKHFIEHNYKGFILCEDEIGHPVFSLLCVFFVVMSVLQSLPALYQILVQLKQLCKLKEQNSGYQKFSSIFEAETCQTTFTTTNLPERISNTRRSFSEVRRNKQRKSVSKHDLRNGYTQDISDESLQSFETEKDKDIRASSKNSQDFHEQQLKQAFGRSRNASEHQVQVHVEDSDPLEEMERKARRRFCHNLAQIFCKFNLETQDQLIQRYFTKKRLYSPRAISYDIPIDTKPKTTSESTNTPKFREIQKRLEMLDKHNNFIEIDEQSD